MNRRFSFRLLSLLFIAPVIGSFIVARADDPQIERAIRPGKIIKIPDDAAGIGDTTLPPPGNTTGRNLALGKPARQSSLSAFSTGADDAEGGNDGQKSGQPKFGFHTDTEPSPWWQVDLEGTYGLGEILLFNRRDAPEVARTVQVLISKDGLNWQPIYTHNGTMWGGDGKPLSILPKGAAARFVRVQLDGKAPLHLEEIEVFEIMSLFSHHPVVDPPVIQPPDIQPPIIQPPVIDPPITKPPTVVQLISVTHNAKRPLLAGETLEITVRGTPGLRATFDLPPLIKNGQLEEFGAGEYIATYKVKPGDHVENGRITVYISAPNGGEDFLQAREPFTISANPPIQPPITTPPIIQPPIIAPPIVTPRSEPKINAVTHNVSRPLHAGDTIEITMRGTAGFRATFDLLPLVKGAPLIEFDAGEYIGTYKVKTTDLIQNGRITAYLRGPNGGEDFGQARGLINIEGVTPPVGPMIPPRKGGILLTLVRIDMSTEGMMARQYWKNLDDTQTPLEPRLEAPWATINYSITPPQTIDSENGDLLFSMSVNPINNQRGGGLLKIFGEDLKFTGGDRHFEVYSQTGAPQADTRTYHLIPHEYDAQKKEVSYSVGVGPEGPSYTFRYRLDRDGGAVAPVTPTAPTLTGNKLPLDGKLYRRGRRLTGPVQIPGAKSEPTDIGLVLEKGKPYIIVGEGECSLWDGQNDGCDSVFRYKTPYEAGGGEKVVWGQLKLLNPLAHLSDLIKQQTGKEPVYNPSHSYEAVTVGEGLPLQAMVHDGGGYGDNSGTLTVTVYETIPVN